MSLTKSFKKENGFVTTPQRSQIMKRIRSKETKPEQFLRKLIWATGLRYRKNVKKLPGSPDIVFAKYKLAVFMMETFGMAIIGKLKNYASKPTVIFGLQKLKRI